MFCTDCQLEQLNSLTLFSLHFRLYDSLQKHVSTGQILIQQPSNYWQKSINIIPMRPRGIFSKWHPLHFNDALLIWLPFFNSLLMQGRMWQIAGMKKSSSTTSATLDSPLALVRFTLSNVLSHLSLSTASSPAMSFCVYVLSLSLSLTVTLAQASGGWLLFLS